MRVSVALVGLMASLAIGQGAPEFVLEWGTNGTGDGQLSGPHGIAVGLDGSVYVADTGNNRVQKFAPDGSFLLKWGISGTGPGQFDHPHGIGVGPLGDVYVAETGNNRVQKFTSEGVFITTWGSLGAGDGQFQHNHGLCVDSAGNVFVADRDQNRVQKFSSDGAFVLAFGSIGVGDGQFSGTNGVAVDAQGNVFVGDTSDRLQKFTNDGVFLASWGSSGNGDGQFNFPRGLSTGSLGSVYVADRNNHRMQRFDGDGNFLTSWGEFGGGQGQFNFPYGVAGRGNRVVYVADSSNHRIQKFQFAAGPIARVPVFSGGVGLLLSLVVLVVGLVALRSRSGLAAILLILAVQNSVAAQPTCFVPDGLDVPLGQECQPVAATLPDFPEVSVRTKFVCWECCTVGVQGDVLLSFSPKSPGCGYLVAPVQMTNLSGGIPLWSGRLILAYSRTFAESTDQGSGPTPNFQVWRFLANGDLGPSSQLIKLFGENPCAVPQCFFTHGAFHVSGYVDFAFDCQNEVWSIALALDHGCDFFEHSNQSTERPGEFHPERSYSWVAPASGFEPDPNQNLGEDSFAFSEGYRGFDLDVPAAPCLTEDPLLKAGRFNAGDFCPCDKGLPQFRAQSFFAVSSLITVSSTSVDVWPNLLFKSLGRWTDGSTYPGPEILFLSQGFLAVQDGCLNENQVEFFRGVFTDSGFSSFSVNRHLDLPAIGSQFLDLGNAVRFSTGLPRIGGSSVTDRVFGLNFGL